MHLRDAPEYSSKDARFSAANRGCALHLFYNKTGFWVDGSGWDALPEMVRVIGFSRTERSHEFLRLALFCVLHWEP